MEFDDHLLYGDARKGRAVRQRATDGGTHGQRPRLIQEQPLHSALQSARHGRQQKALRNAKGKILPQNRTKSKNNIMITHMNLTYSSLQIISYKD